MPTWHIPKSAFMAVLTAFMLSAIPGASASLIHQVSVEGGTLTLAVPAPAGICFTDPSEPSDPPGCVLGEDPSSFVFPGATGTPPSLEFSGPDPLIAEFEFGMWEVNPNDWTLTGSFLFSTDEADLELLWLNLVDGHGEFIFFPEITAPVAFFFFDVLDDVFETLGEMPGETEFDAALTIWLESAAFVGPNCVTGGEIGPDDICGIVELWFTPNHDIPEPGTLAIMGLGLAGLGFARRRKAA